MHSEQKRSCQPKTKQRHHPKRKHAEPQHRLNKSLEVPQRSNLRRYPSQRKVPDIPERYTPRHKAHVKPKQNIRKDNTPTLCTLFLPKNAR